MRYLAALTVLIWILAGTAFAATTPAEKQGHPEFKAPDQAKAVKRSEKVPDFVKDVLIEPPVVRSQRFIREGIDIEDIKHSYFWLDSPILKKAEDRYKGVRFMHTKHASSIQDCTECHHAEPKGEDANATVACSACHQEPFKKGFPERIGLKAAYHLQCLGCHEKEGKAPVGCEGCHLKKEVGHKDLVELPEDPTPFQVTRECLSCHEKAGEDMLKSAHWLWKGPSSYTMRHQKNIQIGKAGKTLNNF
jgi:cytochrome c553